MRICFGTGYDTLCVVFLFQVNPAYLENRNDAEVNAKHLIAIMNEAVNAIFMSTDSCPP